MLSNKNDYDNFEHLKLSIEKPRGQLLCYVQYSLKFVIAALSFMTCFVSGLLQYGSFTGHGVVSVLTNVPSVLTEAFAEASYTTCEPIRHIYFHIDAKQPVSGIVIIPYHQHINQVFQY